MNVRTSALIKSLLVAVVTFVICWFGFILLISTVVFTSMLVETFSHQNVDVGAIVKFFVRWHDVMQAFIATFSLIAAVLMGRRVYRSAAADPQISN